LHEEYDYSSARMSESRRIAGRQVRSDRYLGGLIARAAATCTRSSALRGGRAAETAGGKIFDGISRCCAMTMDRKSPCTRRAAACVRASGALVEMHNRRVAPALERRIWGGGTYIIATEPLGEEAGPRAAASNAAIATSIWILEYFRRSADHRCCSEAG